MGHIAVSPWRNEYSFTCPICGARPDNAHRDRECWEVRDGLENLDGEFDRLRTALASAEERERDLIEILSYCVESGWISAPFVEHEITYGRPIKNMIDLHAAVRQARQQQGEG